jgi:hypothetical protein
MFTIGGVKDDMKEYSDQFLKSNPQNNTVEENWTNNGNKKVK